MNLLTKENIQPRSGDETVFRISIFGPVFCFSFFLLGLILGMLFFVQSYRSSAAWGMILSGVYVLIMWGLCTILFRAVRAALSPANWLARIGPGGSLLKYRSYLHDDFPAEDPIALHLSWTEIADAQLQQELSTTSMSGKSQDRRWFLAIKLDPRYLDVERVRTALEFEKQRRPAYMKVDDLKHELFIARKNRADAGEITRIKREIALEKKRYPGRHGKGQFKDRPVVFIEPDLLKMEWTHVSPGKKRMKQLLARYTTIISAYLQHIDADKQMSEEDFTSRLAALLNRGETIEAVRLVRIQKGLDTTEAKAFIEKQTQ